MTDYSPQEQKLIALVEIVTDETGLDMGSLIEIPVDDRDPSTVYQRLGRVICAYYGVGIYDKITWNRKVTVWEIWNALAEAGAVS